MILLISFLLNPRMILTQVLIVALFGGYFYYDMRQQTLRENALLRPDAQTPLIQLSQRNADLDLSILDGKPTPFGGQSSSGITLNAAQKRALTAFSRVANFFGGSQEKGFKRKSISHGQGNSFSSKKSSSGMTRKLAPMGSTQTSTGRKRLIIPQD